MAEAESFALIELSLVPHVLLKKRYKVTKKACKSEAIWED